jgi:putative membrane protein
MNLKHILKVTGSVALSAVMATASIPVTVYAEENTSKTNESSDKQTASSTKKTETVYAVLNGDGSLSDIVVSGWLHNDSGIKNLKEKLNLTDVKNVKTDEVPEDNNGEYTWNSESNDIYYQGNSTEQLPVTMQITYELDGQQLSQEELKGKSGHLKINIHLTNVNSETKTINGKNVIIHPFFVAGGMLSLNNDHYSNTTCDQGKIVTDGSKQMLVFAAVPGLKDTLDSADLSKVSDQLSVGDDINIECDVTDCDELNLMMGMSNEEDISDILDEGDSIEELTNGITKLMDADDQLVDGSQQLADGTQQLITESEPLTSSSGSIRTLSNGALTLNSGALRLKAALAQYTDGVGQLNDGVNALYAIPDGANQISLGMTTPVEEGKPESSLTGGAAALTAGLQNMKQQVDAGLTSENVTAMMTQLDTAITTLNGLKDTLTKDAETLNELKTTLSTATSQLDGLKTVMTTFVGSSTDSLQASINAIDASIASINSALERIPNDEVNATAKKDLNDSKAALETQRATLAAQAQALSGNASGLPAQLQQTAQSLSGMNDTITSSLGALQGLGRDVDDAIKKLEGMNKMLSGSTSQLGTLANMKGKMDAGFDQLIAGSKKISAGIDQINTGVQALAEQSKTGIDKVKTATSQLASNNEALNEGMASLQTGTQTVANQSDSFNQMADGLDSLKDAFVTLNDGAQQLADGQKQFRQDGLDQLKEKVDLSVDEVEMLKEIMDDIKSMNMQYKEYAGNNPDMDVTTRYVFRTKTSE